MARKLKPSRRFDFSPVLIAVLAALSIGLVVVSRADSAHDPGAPATAPATSSAAAPAATPTSATASIPTQVAPVLPIGLYIHPDRLKELKAQGHAEADIWSAVSLAARTEVPLESWLAARVAGKSWEQAVQELAPDASLNRMPRSDKSRHLTEDEIRRFEADGHSSADVLRAGDLLWLYGSDPVHLLTQRQEGTTWDAIAQAEEALWQASNDPRQATPGRIPSRANLPVPPNLTEADVTALQEQGYSLDEIKAAGHMALSAGLNLLEVAAQKSPEQTLQKAVADADLQRTPEERAAARGRTLPPMYRSVPDMAASSDPRVLIGAPASQEDINFFVSQGYNLLEVRRAYAMAAAYGVDLRAIAATKPPEQSWADAIRAARPAPAPVGAMRTHTSPDEERRVALMASRTGKTPEEIRAERATGKSWTQIAHEFMPAPDAAPVTAVDMAQAENLARAFNKTVTEVLALKRDGLPWPEVVRMLQLEVAP